MSISSIQHINLLPRKADEGYYIFTSTGIIKILLAAMVLLLLVSLINFWGNRQVAAELAKTKETHDTTAQHLLELAESFPVETKDEVLGAQIEALAKERDRKARMLSILTRQSLGKSIGFSRHLSALSEKWVKDSWLTEIVITKGGKEIRLVGKTLDATRIPFLLQRLRHEPAFSGRSFKVLRMNSGGDQNNEIDFYLQTEPEGSAK